jgi:hypothetical protein
MNVCSLELSFHQLCQRWGILNKNWRISWKQWEKFLETSNCLIRDSTRLFLSLSRKSNHEICSSNLVDFSKVAAMDSCRFCISACKYINSSELRPREHDNCKCLFLLSSVPNYGVCWKLIDHRGHELRVHWLSKLVTVTDDFVAEATMVMLGT